MIPDRRCHQTTQALPWLLNGSLAVDERRRVREHLITCPTCRAELARTREMLAMARTAQEASDSPAVSRWSASRRLLSPVPLRRLTLAAAAALAVLVSAGTAWVTLQPQPQMAAAPAPVRPAAPAPAAAPAPEARAEAPAATTAAPQIAAVEPAQPASSREHRAPVVHPSRKTDVRPAAPVIFTTGFEAASVASLERRPAAILAPPDSRLSTLNFEAGLSQ